MVVEGVELTKELLQPDTISLWELGSKFYSEAANQRWSLLKERELRQLGDGVLRLTNSLKINSVDTLFLLEKSAHPLGGLIRSLCTNLGLYPIPTIEYVNLRPFKERPLPDFYVTDKEKMLFKETFGDLTGQTICIADAYSHQGKGVKRARNIIQASNPNIKDIAMTRVFKELDHYPSWEGDAELLGVKDRYITLKDIEKYMLPTSGRPIVYTSIHAPTAKSRRLDIELAQFAEIVANNAVTTNVLLINQYAYTNEVVFID